MKLRTCVVKIVFVGLLVLVFLFVRGNTTAHFHLRVKQVEFMRN